MPRPKVSNFNKNRVVSSAPRPRKPCDYTWMQSKDRNESGDPGVAVDRNGNDYVINECCGVWDRGVDYHAPKCPNATKFVGTGKKEVN